MAYRRRYGAGPKKYVKHRSSRRQPTWALDTWRHYTPPQARKLMRCRSCGLSTGVFLARSGPGRAMYHCAAPHCSAYFTGEHPKPLEA